MKRITIAKGDGIGPEIMEATLEILKAAGAPLEYDEIVIGEKAYLSGHTSGISPESWDILRKNKVFLKAPITTPQGGGFKSLNVTTRKTLSLFANVRPIKSYHPFVHTKHEKMDMVIVRENEEDLYAGIEHRQTDEVEQCLKLITRPGCEKIVKYAFEYARTNGRKKVTCFSKDNIMKQTDGLFRKVFNEFAAQYPDIESDHMIIDIGSAKLAEQPENFDVIVTANLYGDIISDIAAQISGSVGLCGSSNIGEECAMFEAIHGSAPDIAGQKIANPSGLLQGAILMLRHLGEGEVAAKIENAWLKTLEDKIHTRDIYDAEKSEKLVNTKEFAEEVIKRLGQQPEYLSAVISERNEVIQFHKYERKTSKKELKGVDVFIHHGTGDAVAFGDKLKEAGTDKLELVLITNRGVKVWPDGFKETFCTDHWRCRFMTKNEETIQNDAIFELLKSVHEHGFDAIKTENLYYFDGERGFSLGQGQ